MADRSDIEILERLLSTEQRLISAYEAGLRRDAIDSELAGQLLAHEREHVRALQKTLGDGAERNPRATVPSPELTGALRSRSSFARFARRLEAEAVTAYAEAAASIRDPKLRQPLGSIMACEAAHVVALRDSLGERLLVN
jgi:rubrerythrin